MKNIKMAILAIGLLGFAACSSDDDEGDAIDNCITCTFTVVVEDLVTEYCDNGDGTVTATTLGQSETVDLEGANFDQFIAAFELLGNTCN